MTRRLQTDGGGDGSRPKSVRNAYDIGSDERPSEAAVRAVSMFTDTSPLDLDPLYDAIDPGHLDGVFGTDGTSARTGGSVAFAFGGCRVTVTHGEIRVREIDGGDSG